MKWYNRLMNIVRDDAHSRSPHETARDPVIFTRIGSVAADVRYAVRTFAANPVFTLVIVVSLGLGIGANTAIFTLIDALVLKSLPVAKPDELVEVTMGKNADVFTNPLWEAIRDRQDVFSGTFAYASHDFDLSNGGEVRTVPANWVSGEFFSTLGLPPTAGRLILRGDDTRGCAAVAVLSDGFWRSEYGASPGVLGKSISLDGHPFEIIGVAAQGFTGVSVGSPTQVYAPLCAQAIISGSSDELDNRLEWYLNVVGRLKNGMTADAAASKLASLSPSVFRATLPVEFDGDRQQQQEYLAGRLTVRSAAAGLSPLRDSYKEALYILLAVVGLVLLIACANVANLLLARATAREREMAIRLAIGAGRVRLIRQLLTESLLLSAAGAFAGVGFAVWGSRLLVSLLATRTKGVSVDLSVDWRVMGFTVAIAVATGLLFGLAPAIRAARVDPQVAMRSGGRTSPSRSRLAIAKVLVVLQVALSLVLVLAGGLLVGTFQRLATIDPGFRPEGVLLVAMDAQRAKYSSDQQAAAQRQVLNQLRSAPGVRGAASSMITPISGSGWNGDVAAEGFVPKDRRDGTAFFNAVSDGYFATMGSTLRSGRDIAASDVRGSTKVAVINETMAKKLFGGRSPIGRVFYVTNGRVRNDAVQVIGVVQDAKYRSLKEETPPTAFMPASQQETEERINYEVRGNGDPSRLIPAVKKAIESANPAFSIQFTTLDEQISATLRRPRLLATLSGFFGTLALLLAVVGLYGIISYSVERRRTEIGVRIALGAGRGTIVRMVLWEVVGVVLVGSLIGAGLSFYTTRIVKAFLFGVSANDPATFAASAGLLAVVAIAAGMVPAYRAARVSPMRALRED